MGLELWKAVGARRASGEVRDTPTPKWPGREHWDCCKTDFGRQHAEKRPGPLLRDIHPALCFLGEDSGPSQASLVAASSRRLAAGYGAAPCVRAETRCVLSAEPAALGGSGGENVLVCLHGTCGISSRGRSEQAVDTWF